MRSYTPSSMRLSLCLLLLAAASLPTAAQTADPDASGIFGETGTSVGYSGDGIGLTHTLRATVGYRFPSGVHLAATGHEGGSTRYGTLSFGPEVGYTQSIAPSTTLRLRLDGRASYFTGGALSGQGVQRTAYTSVAEGTLTRRFNLGRGVSFAATGGLYGGLVRTSDLDAGVRGQVEAGTFAEAGPVLGLQAEFNALGGRFAIGPHVGVPLLTKSRTVPGVGPLYESRQRSLVSFSF